MVNDEGELASLAVDPGSGYGPCSAGPGAQERHSHFRLL